MVECCPSPTLGGVARTAIRTELPCMRIPGRVAGVTIGWSPLENTIRMTGTTCYIAVLSGQWETCIAVVECCPSPTVCGVAGSTICTELTAMRIISSMAGITIRGCALENTVRMARFTGNILMFSI